MRTLCTLLNIFSLNTKVFTCWRFGTFFSGIIWGWDICYLGGLEALNVLEMGRFFGFLYEYLMNVHTAEYVIKPC
jgi:hypothetical protein